MDLFPREHSEAAWLFNCGRYFDAHERWESLWLKESPGPRRIFYQMLIHAAVCLHHWARANRMGLVLQWRQFDRKAETFSGGAHALQEVLGAATPGMTRALPLGPDQVLPIQPGFDIQESSAVLFSK